MAKKYFLLAFVFVSMPLFIDFSSAVPSTKPGLTSVSPNIVYAVTGTQIILRGENLDEVTSIESNGIVYTLLFFQPFTVTPTSVTFTLPSAIPENTYRIAVITADQQKSNTIPLIVLYNDGGTPQPYPVGVGGPTRQNTRDIWMSPNLGPSAYLDLFSQENQWTDARANIDVFKFYQVSLAPNPVVACQPCGDVTYPNLLANNAFSKLNQWNIDIGIEVGAIKPHDRCAADVVVPLVLRAIHNVYKGGGEVAYLAMDEPYNGGVSTNYGGPCGMTMQQIARETASYITTIRSFHPNIQIGDIEPYPYFSAEQIMDWINELERLGIHLDFFHLDVNYNRPDVRNNSPLLIADMAQLKQFFAGKNIPYGVIYWGAHAPQDPFSDFHFYNTTLEWTSFVKNNNLYGEQHIFQSWDNVNGMNTGIPTNLPEHDPSTYSMTRLVDDGLAVLNEPDAQFVFQQVSTLMVAGRQYPASITFRNRGRESWDASRNYYLASQHPQNTALWGVSKVPLFPSERVLSNNQKTFSFTITAPSTPGNYTFQWRMTHEGIEAFGDLSPPLSVAVTQSCVPGQQRNCPSQQGVCAGAQETCVGGVWNGCAASTYGSHHAAYHPREVNYCGDELDNDCDGATDSADSDCPNDGATTNDPGTITPGVDQRPSQSNKNKPKITSDNPLKMISDLVVVREENKTEAYLWRFGLIAILFVLVFGARLIYTRLQERQPPDN